VLNSCCDDGSLGIATRRPADALERENGNPTAKFNLRVNYDESHRLSDTLRKTPVSRRFRMMRSPRLGVGLQGQATAKNQPSRSCELCTWKRLQGRRFSGPTGARDKKGRSFIGCTLTSPDACLDVPLRALQRSRPGFMRGPSFEIECRPTSPDTVQSDFSKPTICSLWSLPVVKGAPEQGFRSNA